MASPEFALSLLADDDLPALASFSCGDADLDDFVKCYRPGDRHKRRATWSAEKNPQGRWRAFSYEEIAARDKCSLDLFWLRDESLEDSASLPDPQVLAQEIADDLRSALAQIEDILGELDERAHAAAGR